MNEEMLIQLDSWRVETADIVHVSIIKPSTSGYSAAGTVYSLLHVYVTLIFI